MSRRPSGPRLRPYSEPGYRAPIYRIEWTEGGRTRRRSTGESDLGRAEAAFTAWLQERGAGRERRGDPAEVHVTDILDAYQRERGPETAAPATLAYACDPLRHFFARDVIADLTAERVKAYWAWRRVYSVATKEGERAPTHRHRRGQRRHYHTGARRHAPSGNSACRSTGSGSRPASITSPCRSGPRGARPGSPGVRRRGFCARPGEIGAPGSIFRSMHCWRSTPVSAAARFSSSAGRRSTCCAAASILIRRDDRGRRSVERSSRCHDRCWRRCARP